MSLDLGPYQSYFQDKLDRFGSTPRGVDWNSVEAQELRFAQLAKLFEHEASLSLLDYGSGFGSLYDYLRKLGKEVHYVGYDFVADMVAKGRALHPSDPHCSFTSRLEELPEVDYAVESGIFNIQLSTRPEDWRAYVTSVLERMNRLARKGIAFNMLTSYSDAEHMKPHLYYADPGFYFDYCKRHYSRNVALLHDYELYDFTILIRK